MRKLLLQMQISLDGYVADENENTDWMVWNWGDQWLWDQALRLYQHNVSASVDTILLSRKMAVEGFIHHWAEMAMRDDNPQSGFAREIKEARKVVFTTTLQHSKWENTVLAKGDLFEEVTALKKAVGRNIIAYGGATFASSLISADLVDEFHLIINPCILGNGLPIFKGLRLPLHLSLVSSTCYTSGIVVSIYKRDESAKASIDGDDGK